MPYERTNVLAAITGDDIPDERNGRLPRRTLSDRPAIRPGAGLVADAGSDVLAH